MFKKIFIIFIAGILVLGINGLSFAMMCHGGGGSHRRHKQFTESTSEEAVNVGNQICPVSGEKITEEMKATYEYKGKIYNFCCTMCIEEFKKDPEKYIEKVEEELQK